MSRAATAPGPGSPPSSLANFLGMPVKNVCADGMGGTSDPSLVIWVLCASFILALIIRSVPILLVLPHPVGGNVGLALALIRCLALCS